MARRRPPSIRVDLTVFRYSNYDSPFWARNNRTPGRWHAVGDGATQYLALVPNGAWAELARAERLRHEAELAEVRMPIWAARVTQHDIVDYRTFAHAEAAGFEPSALVDDDYARCQHEGNRLREAGFAGVLAPSAALPDAVNLTLFGRRVLSSWEASPTLASCIPACVVAVGCSSPGLSDHVRHYGDDHAGYAEYIDHLAELRRIASLGASPLETDDAAAESEDPGDSPSTQ